MDVVMGVHGNESSSVGVLRAFTSFFFSRSRFYASFFSAVMYWRKCEAFSKPKILAGSAL
jgi:hypothetical protein